jgi:hypothetical protein
MGHSPFSLPSGCPNTTVPGHDFTYEELVGPTKINSTRTKSESPGILSQSGWNLRVRFALPEHVSSSAPRSSHNYEDYIAESGSISVAVSSETSSVFDASFSTDEDEYERDEYTDPPSSIMIERPSYKNAYQ